MQTPDISYLSLGVCALMLSIPALIIILFKIPIGKQLIIAIIRMIIQLLLIGIFLKYIFSVNNVFLTVGWFLIMILFASLSVINSSNLKLNGFFIPVFISFFIANGSVILFVNTFVIQLNDILAPQFLIVLGGMLLGNSLKGSIIGIRRFYSSIYRNENRYFFHLANGASAFELLGSYFKESIIEALKPTMATMATMGIVFLPGMMTGQIIGGITPIIAIKYQIVIMLAIFTATALSVSLSILFSVQSSFTEYGVLRKELFIQK